MGIGIYRLVTHHFLEFLDETLKDTRPQKVWIISAFVTMDGAQTVKDWTHDETDVRIITGTFWISPIQMQLHTSKQSTISE